MSIASLTSQLPFTSTVYQHATTGLAVTASLSLFQGSMWAVMASGFAAMASFAVGQVKQAAEVKESNKKAGQEISFKLIRFAKECVDLEKNGYSIDTRGSMHNTLKTLESSQFAIYPGGDMRSTVVGLQQIFEHVLKIFTKFEDLRFQGTIHTHTPPTPLCQPVNSNDLSSVMAKSLLSNLDNILTVTNRTTTLTEILNDPKTKLFAVYSKGGLEKRSDADQKVFSSHARYYLNTLQPIELPLELHSSHIGATYILITPHGNCAFCIDAPQASQEVAEKWGIFCGSLEEPIICNRVNSAFDHIVSKGGPDIRLEIEKATNVKIPTR